MRGIKKDTLVYVKQKESDPWLPRYFSHHEPLNHQNTEFRCYEDGKMSHETKVTLPWRIYSEYDPSLFKEGDVVEKGWEINLSNINEGYLYSDLYCWANTRGEAKSKFMKMSEVDGMKDNMGDDITFINIPIRRCKNIDKIIFRGNIVRRNSIPELLETEKRVNNLKDIMDNDTITHCYIKKRGDYYRENMSGYATNKEHAGVYTKKVATDHVGTSLEILIIPIDNEEHNKFIQEKIDSLKSKLL